MVHVVSYLVILLTFVQLAVTRKPSSMFPLLSCKPTVTFQICRALLLFDQPLDELFAQSQYVKVPWLHVESMTCLLKESNEGYSSLQASLPSPLRELACHMGSHSVTCHPAELTFPPLPQPKLVLDLATPEGFKAELT